MQAKKDMPKRYHLNRPDLAQAVAVELRICQDVKSQQRLLAARLAASGQLTAAQAACDPPEAARGVLLAGKIGRGLEGAAQDPRTKRRGRRGKVPTHALRTVGELERGWWKAGAPVGGR